MSRRTTFNLTWAQTQALAELASSHAHTVRERAVEMGKSESTLTQTCSQRLHRHADDLKRLSNALYGKVADPTPFCAEPGD